MFVFLSEQISSIQSTVTKFRSTLKNSFEDFARNCDKWSKSDFLTWVSLYEKAKFESYRTNLEKLFEKGDVDEKEDLSVAETILPIVELPRVLGIRCLMSMCEIKDQKIGEEIFDVLSAAFRV